jgi:hypothetical protein
VRARRVEVADLVDLVGDRERGGKKGDQWIAGLGDRDGHLLVPGVLVEIAADQLPVVRPVIEGVRCGMHADEAAAGPYEVEQRRLLRFAHRQLARGEEHHRPIAAQIFRRENRHILGRRHRKAVPRADLFEHRLRRRDDLVPVAGRAGEIEQARILRLRWLWEEGEQRGQRRPCRVRQDGCGLERASGPGSTAPIHDRCASSTRS